VTAGLLQEEETGVYRTLIGTSARKLDLHRLYAASLVQAITRKKTRPFDYCAPIKDD
jgi:hypothetical protein